MTPTKEPMPNKIIRKVDSLLKSDYFQRDCLGEEFEQLNKGNKKPK